MTFSIIIVHYGDPEITKACVKSILKSDHHSFEIIVVDNGNAKRFEMSPNPKLFISRSLTNRLYAGGMNFGAKFAKGNILIFLNNDTTVSPDWLKKIELYMNGHKWVAIAQPFISNSDNKNWAGNTIDWLGYTKISDKWDKHFYCAGVCIIVRKHIFLILKGFREDFGMQYEDVEFSWRVKNYRDMDLGQIKDVTISHIGQQATGKVNQSHTCYLIRRNRLLCYKAHNPKVIPFIILSYLLLPDRKASWKAVKEFIWTR